MREEDPGYVEKDGFSFRFNDNLTKKHFHRLKEQNPRRFKPQDICNEAINNYVRDWLGEKGNLKADILEVKDKINMLEADILNTNNNLSELTLMKEKLENNLTNLEDQLEKTEESVKEGDVVMNLINAVEKVKNQYSTRTRPDPNLLIRLSQETKVKPEIIKLLGKDYHRGRISRADLEKMEEARVRSLMEQRPELAPTFDFEYTGKNLVNYLSGKVTQH